MGIEWLWQGLLTNWISTIGQIVFVAAVTSMLAIFKAKWPKYAGPTLYGAVGLFLSVLLLLTIHIASVIPKSAVVDTDHPKEAVEKLLSNLGNSYVEGYNPSDEFQLYVTLGDGNKLTIAQPKNFPNDLMIAVVYSFPPAFHDRIEKLNPADVEKLKLDVGIELLRSQIAFSFERKDNDKTPVLNFDEVIPVREATEMVLMHSIVKLELAELIIEFVASRDLNLAWTLVKRP
jgi:hypothetical protein